MIFTEATKFPRSWLLKLAHEKRKQPVRSEKNWSGRNKNPPLIFVEGVKFSRIWLLKLDRA
ncbi:hypothetical protein BMT55_13645 [Listeria newyorkensis]|uniref:Uncharacterized protein n=1 Tax=Listeria newyorkensis TaxID=1497681 RepID=A0ABX4XQH8_9LIST|nr:hypothetical protein EP58_11295 [Listeria newyorkensis]PNP89096.1 hypothetical protein BMT55_13645 [Listeria newyorkensis]